ncbi:MAG: DUF933 domain-containing protein, partial [bacterium]|nr:DUF933 domain-containing protein [bacterium]
KVLAHLEQEKPYSTIELEAEDALILWSYTFLSAKPIILVANLDDEQFRTMSYDGREELLRYCVESGIPIVEISADTEAEIAALSKEDQEMFCAELKIEEPGVSRLARAAYQVLGLISFFTVGEDEVRAWTIPVGSTAKQAAGKIHTDLERGFIRAELMKFSDMKTLGSPAKLKEKGLMALEGKDYIVLDGDILSIRFNV